MHNSDTHSDEDAPKESQGDWLFSRLPEWVIDTLTTEQKEAIYSAATDPSWDRPPINIRLSIPFLKRRYFLTIIGGEGKRSIGRRASEEHKYPLRTAANIFFILGIGTLFYIATLIAISLQGAIIEF